MRSLFRAFFAVTLVATVLPVLAGSPSPSNLYPPVASFQAPASYDPGGRTSAGVTKTTFTDAGNPVPFIPLVACRQYDSRNTSALPNATPRAVTLSGAPCGIPTQAIAVAVNITVFSITGATGNGVFKAGNVNPPTTAWINYPPAETQRANAGVLPVAGSATLYVQVNQGAGSVDVVVDVFGYYSYYPANQQHTFSLFNNGPGATMFLYNASSSCAGICGLQQTVESGTAIEGMNNGGDTGYGVYGASATSNGVYGITGVGGIAGIYGRNVSDTDGSQGVGGSVEGTGIVFGVRGQISTAAAAGSAGVHGIGAATAGRSFGVLGETASNTDDSAAVYGVMSGAAAGSGLGSAFSRTGVRGESKEYGVLGLGNMLGVMGRASTTAGTLAGFGVLGLNAGSTTYGVYGAAGATDTTRWAVYASGNLGASGTKPFVEPHPYKAGTVIRYVALEGPEAGTYFRGRGRFVGGKAVIEVPEDFRLVTDEEGITVQITPIGRMASVGATRVSLDGIEAEASRDVEFSFLVQGVRKTFKDWKVTVESGEFTPESPAARIPTYLSEKQKQNLIQSGVYHADGTVNMQTAERMGWAQKWREQAQPAQQEISRAPQDSGKAPRE